MAQLMKLAIEIFVRICSQRNPGNWRAIARSIALTALLSSSCSSGNLLLQGSGIREAVYRQKTDLLLTELHYPITTNSNLDALLRERILSKYRSYRKQFDEDSLTYLNSGNVVIYRSTFDALRSPDLKIISFVIYQTIEVYQEGPEQSWDRSKDAEALHNSGSGNTEAEVFMYSLKYESAVDFLDVLAEPLLVFEGLARSCLQQLREHIGVGNFYSQGVKPDRQHLSMLSFGKSGIRVSFPPGQVMSLDQGVVHILVPWAEAIPVKPWQFGIIRSFRPLGYRSRKKEALAVKNYLQGTE